MFSGELEKFRMYVCWVLGSRAVKHLELSIVFSNFCDGILGIIRISYATSY